MFMFIADKHSFQCRINSNYLYNWYWLILIFINYEHKTKLRNLFDKYLDWYTSDTEYYAFN